jgi:ELWxxDGT repeat protein
MMSLLLPSGVWGQASMVKEIYPLATGGLESSIEAAVVGNKLLFAADNSTNGQELWISDGTDAGTFMLKDLEPGTRTTSSNPQKFFTYQGVAYFYTHLGNWYDPWKLWRSDGTVAGTYQIGGAETNDNQQLIVDNTLYFISNNGLILKELDKTGHRTILDRSYNTDINTFPKNATQVGRMGANWLFTANSASNRNDLALYHSDGTKTGTKKLINLSNTDGELAATASGRLAFFANDDGSFGAELWITDGTTAGTKMLKNIAPGGLSGFNSLNWYPEYHPLFTVGERALFVANDGTTGSELWVSDGTETGTRLLKEFTAGSTGTSFHFYSALEVGTDAVYFRVNDREIWRSDGTDAGTYRLTSRTDNEFYLFRKSGDSFYYRDISNRRLYRLNGRPDNSQVIGTLQNIDGGWWGAANYLLAGNTVFYAGNTNTTGWELWKLSFCDHQARISAPVGASFCTGASIELEASGAGGAGPFTYKWTSGTNNLGTNAKLTVNQTGTYSVEVTDSRGCAISTSIQAAESRNLPVAISGEAGFCAGTSVPFSGTAAGGTAPYTYQWRQSFSNIAGATSTTLNVNTSGTYSLSVTDSKGCTGTSNAVSVSQKSSPSATISTNGATIVAPGASLSVILTTPAASGQTYQWFRDGVAIAGATNNNYLATVAGGYTVQVNRDGCSATSSVTRLAVGLGVTTSGTPSFCVGGSTSLTITPTTGDAPFTYSWRLGSTTISTSNTATISTAGTYSVTVTDSRGVIGTIAALQVTQRPVPTATITANGPLVLQPGTSVVLSAPNVAGNTYQWLRNGTALAGAVGATYTANTAGDYTVTVTQNSCSATSVPTRVSLALLATLSGANQLCSGQSATLVAGNTNGEAPFTYQWRLSGSVINATGNTLIVTAGGTYAVTITDSRGLIGVSSDFAVTTKPSPNAAISSVGQLPLQPGTSAVLSVVAVPTQTYQWSRDGQALAGATGSSLTVTQAGTYGITVTRDGCVSSSAAFPVALILSTEPTALGLSLEASPNPANGLIRVRLTLDEAAPATLRLFDSSGRQVRMHPFGTAQRQHEHRFDLSNVPSGILYLRAEVGDKQLTKKIVKD